MHITRPLLDKAARQGVIDAAQAEALWRFLAEQTVDTPSFRVTHIFYYLGGLIAIGAMTLFMALGWSRLGGWGLAGIALAYGVAGIALTESLFRRPRLSIPAGITAAFVVAVVPLAIYGLQAALGFWEPGRAYRDYHRVIDPAWLVMELGTLVAGALMLWRYRLPFLVMPVAVTLWYMSLDIAPALLAEPDPRWELRSVVSLWFGLLMVLAACWADLRTRPDKDYPFWLYLVGALAFWGGLTAQHADTEWGRFAYLCINLAMIAVGAILSRRVFVVLGALGTAGYVGHLAYTVFEGSIAFPFVLTAIGFGVIWLGLLWQRHEQAIATSLRARLPAGLRAWLAQRET